jgi:hypothetical protein
MGLKLKNDFLKLILRIFTASYYAGITICVLFFTSYFIYIKYIPNIQEKFIFEGFIFIALMGGIFGIAFLVIGFNGIYYLGLFKKELQSEQKGFFGINEESDNIKEIDEKIIDKHRYKFGLIHFGILLVYIFAALLIFQYSRDCNVFYFWLILLIAICFLYIALTAKIGFHKTQGNPLTFGFCCRPLFKDKESVKDLLVYIAYLLVTFVSLLFLGIVVLTLFPIALNHFKLTYEKFISEPIYLRIGYFISYALIVSIFITFINLITFDISSLFINKNNEQYFYKNIAQVAIVPISMFIVLFFMLKLYIFPFSYFRLGSFKKNIIVNTSGMEILRLSNYPGKITKYINKNIPYCMTDDCFKTESFILSNMGSDIYLTQKTSTKQTHVNVVIPKKDFLFRSYINPVSK